MASVTDKKIEKLYASLGPKEIRRMQAKFAREHKPDEINRLGRAVAQEHAELYNQGLKLLRVLNGNALDWIGLYRLGMERDRFRFQHALRETAIDAALQAQLLGIWKFIKYPITGSEYRALRRLRRDEPVSLNGYAEILSEVKADEPGLHPAIASYLNTLPQDTERIYHDYDSPDIFMKSAQAVVDDVLQETFRRGNAIAKGIRAIIDDAIKKDELPMPKKHDGELSLPWGVLTDWGEGTTEETYDIGGPGLNIPMLLVFEGQLAPHWDIRSDRDADAVKEEREQMLQNLPMRPTIPRSVRDEIGSLDPPRTMQELQREEERAQEFREKWFAPSFTAPLMVNAAEVHAEHRAQFEGIREALEIVQRDDFFGEDPLFPEIRAQLDAAQEEADRFRPLWKEASADWMLRRELYTLQGLDPPDISPLTDLEELEAPAPMPTKEPETEEMLQLLRGWGD